MSTQRLNGILNDLEECFDGRPWYGDALMKKLEGLDWRYINDKKYHRKSIAVLVKHIINWRVFVLKKLQGDAQYDLVIDGPNDWSMIFIANEGEWKSLLNELRGTQTALIQILSSSTDDLLLQKVPGKKYSFGDVLPSIAQHDIYHLGQIAMLYSMRKG